MRTVVCAVALVALAACGVDGPPERPTVATTTTVGVGDSGVNTGTKVSVFSGKVTMGVGVGL
ncbi:lipoprotein [Roseovarius pelagicus]|uniref:Lipoprotein n=1 Tax=Roseovarius pelagicus TaxID=2980108 RepID=A0ABY6DFU3_9RHOB|nr:lipoprotein [Roseovarius pelagicus]UXX85021.1 lipoprotein [Roseovarius pelagicus]